MTREETLTLFATGKDAWNAWAAEMRSKRDAMEQSGEWQTNNLFPWHGENDATRCWLRDATVDFSDCKVQQTSNGVDFSVLMFPGITRFKRTQFLGDAKFEGATFPGDAVFEGATFVGNARFFGATFCHGAYFEGATFVGGAEFANVRFFAAALFKQVTFRSNVGFAGVTFTRYASFDSATISGYAHLQSATFSGWASFSRATFSGNSEFAASTFLKEADFDGVTFSGFANFDDVTFSGKADFEQCTFGGHARYCDATFNSSSSFRAVHAERAFSLADAKFAEPPDFVQAHFAEAPPLDNVHVGPLGNFWKQMKVRVRQLLQPFAEAPPHIPLGGRFWYRLKARVRQVLQRDANAPSRYRALRRLAVQGHDRESEMRFFAREITSARFVSDWPLSWRVWSAKAWSGVVRFWFGLIYQIVSDFGRSVLRPLLLWVVTAGLAAGYFLGQSPDVTTMRNAAVGAGAPYNILTYATSSIAAWQKQQPCFGGLPDRNLKGEPLVSGLAGPVRHSTNAATEAMHLALRNALIFVDGGSEAAFRTFGCLYGLERYAIVPSDVSFVSALQKAVSVVLIFLVGLAVRNMLRMN